MTENRKSLIKNILDPIWWKLISHLELQMPTEAVMLIVPFQYKLEVCINPETRKEIGTL
jgi:hypothetical protein